jgi:hypothetical protein
MDRRLARGRAAACASLAALALSVAAGGDVAAAAARSPHSTPRPPHRTPPSSHGHTVYQSRHLWATIDVCAPSDRPSTVGVRGSMPGSGLADESMYMRFQLQYRDASGAWLDIGASADSGFLAIGPSVFKARQSGRSFMLGITPGSHYVVRGVVTFEWRRRGHVVRNAQKQTTAGHQALAGADPPSYSAAACELS